VTDVEALTWSVSSVHHVVDGDTLHLYRRRTVVLDQQLAQDIYDRVPQSIRLVWVDTPERGVHPGWEQARADLTGWIKQAQARGPLTVITYASGGWDRLLGDVLDVDGGSASQWLLTGGNAGKGWPYYQGT
jgi:endonuclease YncB( thermonuclease family)